MNRVLETDYDNRFIRVQSGRTNLSVTGAVEADELGAARGDLTQPQQSANGNVATRQRKHRCRNVTHMAGDLIKFNHQTMSGLSQ